jgi:hypothetical protein
MAGPRRQDDVVIGARRPSRASRQAAARGTDCALTLPSASMKRSQ